ncbi:MAG: glycosyltransferase family A protein [Gemmatimonadota bacterium]
MSGAPVWSVVIPTKDRLRELGECLRRLSPGVQTLDAGQYEVVVTDDGDFDATDAMLRAEFPWTRHVRGPHRGPAANRNAGARGARGAWLVFADDDVVPSPGWLSAYAALADGAEVLEGRTTCSAGLPSPRFHAPENNAGGVLWSCNFAIDRALFGGLGGFDEGFPFAHMEDADLRERLRTAGKMLRWVNEARVDHPPRRQPPGTRLGEYREAEVRYLYKHGASRPVRWRLMRNIALSRLVNIRARPKGIDSLLALWALAAELWHVVRHAASWERASAREFPVERAT